MPKKIYIVMTNTGSRVSKVLSLALSNKYPHVSIALDRDLKRMYSFARRNMYIPLIGGFVKEDIGTGIYAKYKNTKCVVFELDVTDEEYAIIEREIDEFIENYDDYLYNVLGLIPMYFDIPINRTKHYVCSHFVAEVLSRAGILEFAKQTSLIRPTDFWNIDKKRTIYSGKLSNYRYWNRLSNI